MFSFLRFWVFWCSIIFVFENLKMGGNRVEEDLEGLWREKEDDQSTFQSKYIYIYI